jgi:hypothetical protein
MDMEEDLEVRHHHQMEEEEVVVELQMDLHFEKMQWNILEYQFLDMDFELHQIEINLFLHEVRVLMLILVENHKYISQNSNCIEILNKYYILQL